MEARKRVVIRILLGRWGTVILVIKTRSAVEVGSSWSAHSEACFSRAKRVLWRRCKLLLLVFYFERSALASQRLERNNGCLICLSESFGNERRAKWWVVEFIFVKFLGFSFAWGGWLLALLFPINNINTWKRLLLLWFHVHLLPRWIIYSWLRGQNFRAYQHGRTPSFIEDSSIGFHLSLLL